MLIPCHRGGHHCRFPACPLDCDGRKIESAMWKVKNTTRAGVEIWVEKMPSGVFRTTRVAAVAYRFSDFREARRVGALFEQYSGGDRWDVVEET